VKRRSNGKTPLEFEVGVTTSGFLPPFILRKFLASLPMTEKKYHKNEIATEQLKTAIFLFLNCRDPSSVITLAGAASNILERLVRNEGKTPFIDYARNVQNVLGGFTPPRSKYARYINEKLGINPHKHMSPECPDTLEIDLHKSAEDTITKAIADYTKLYGREHDFIKAFLSWAWVNRDGPQVMRDHERLPARIKNYGRPKLPKD
jgi:hypothetical protein